jgi:hypothetical protein
MSSIDTTKYANTALQGEIEKVATAPLGDRNGTLFRAAASLGELVASGLLNENEVRQELERAADGYIHSDGLPAARATIESGLRKGKEKPREIPRDGFRPDGAVKIAKRAGQVAVTPEQARTVPAAFPTWTPPGGDGKPRFHPWGAEGPPRQRNEIRRHVYATAGEPVRLKIKYREGEHSTFADWYRVVDATGSIGWQAKKPASYAAVPYTGGLNIFDPEIAPDQICWPDRAPYGLGLLSPRKGAFLACRTLRPPP